MRTPTSEYPTKVWPRSILLVLLSFNAVTAGVGGVIGVAFNGGGVPLTYLAGTPFSSYVLPGLILALVVGGTHTLAAVSVWRRLPYGPLSAAIAGYGMIIWIFVELTVTGYSWLQSIYLGLGLTELALVLVLSGVLRPARRSPEALDLR